MLKTEAFNVICRAAEELKAGVVTLVEFQVAVATVLDEIMPVKAKVQR